MQGERVTVQGERVTGEWYANYFDRENITILGFQPKRNLVCLSICVTSRVSFYVQTISATPKKNKFPLFPKAYPKNHGLIFVLFHVFSMFTSHVFFNDPPQAASASWFLFHLKVDILIRPWLVDGSASKL